MSREDLVDGGELTVEDLVDLVDLEDGADASFTDSTPQYPGHGEGSYIAVDGSGAGAQKLNRTAGRPAQGIPSIPNHIPEYNNGQGLNRQFAESHLSAQGNATRRVNLGASPHAGGLNQVDAYDTAPTPPRRAPRGITAPPTTGQSIERIKVLLEEYSNIQAGIDELERLHREHCFDNRGRLIHTANTNLAAARAELNRVDADDQVRVLEGIIDNEEELVKQFQLNLTEDEKDKISIKEGDKNVGIETILSRKAELERKKEEIKGVIDGAGEGFQAVHEGLGSFFQGRHLEIVDHGAEDGVENGAEGEKLRRALNIQQEVLGELFAEHEIERLRGLKEVFDDLQRDDQEKFQKYKGLHEEDGRGEWKVKGGVSPVAAQEALEQGREARARIDAHRRLVTQELGHAIGRFSPRNPNQFFEQASALIDAGADTNDRRVHQAIRDEGLNQRGINEALDEVAYVNQLIEKIEQNRDIKTTLVGDISETEKDLRVALGLDEDEGIPDADPSATTPETERVTDLRGKLAQLNDLSANPQTLAFDAAENNNFEVVRKLIDAGIVDKDSVGNHNHTLLHHAAQHNNEKAVKYLLGKGADTSLKNNFKDTALHLAIISGHVKTATLVIEAASKAKGGETVGGDRAKASLEALEEMMAVESRDGQTAMELAFAGGGGAAPIVFAAHAQHASLERKVEKENESAVKIQALFRGRQARKKVGNMRAVKLAKDMEVIENHISDNLTEVQFNNLTKVLLAATYVLMNQGEKTSSSDMQFRDYFKEACAVLNGKGQFENYLYNCKRHSQGKIPVSNDLMPGTNEINAAFDALNKARTKELIKTRRGDGKDVVITNSGAPASVKNLLGIYDEGKNGNRSAKKRQELEGNIVYYRKLAAKLQAIAGTGEAGLNVAITEALSELTAEKKKAFPYKDLAEMHSGTDTYLGKIGKLRELQTKAENNMRSILVRIRDLPTSDANYYKEFAGVRISNLTLTKEDSLDNSAFRGVIFDGTCNIGGDVFENNNFYNCKTIATDNSLTDFEADSSVRAPFPIDDNVNYAAAKTKNSDNFAEHDTNPAMKKKLTDFLEENGSKLLDKHFAKNATGEYINGDEYNKEALDKGIKSLIQGQARAPHIDRSVNRVMGKANMIEHPVADVKDDRVNIQRAKDDILQFFDNGAQNSSIIESFDSFRAVTDGGGWKKGQFTQAYKILKSLQDSLIDSTKDVNVHLDGKNIDFKGAQYPVTKVSQYATALKSVIDEQLVKTLGDTGVVEGQKTDILNLSKTQRKEEVVRYKENYAPSSSVRRPAAAGLDGRGATTETIIM